MDFLEVVYDAFDLCGGGLELILKLLDVCLALFKTLGLLFLDELLSFSKAFLFALLFGQLDFVNSLLDHNLLLAE
jgi:hypothetical protein